MKCFSELTWSWCPFTAIETLTKTTQEFQAVKLSYVGAENQALVPLQKSRVLLNRGVTVPAPLFWFGFEG